MAKSRRHLNTPRAPKPRSGAEAEWTSAAQDAGVPVEQLMREVAQFRVALEADMTIAAAAAEIGDDAWAGEIIDNEREHLADFERRTLRALAEAERIPARRPARQSPRMPKVWMATAAAIALITALGTAVARTDKTPESTSTLALAAASRYADFAQLASGGSTAAELTEAAALLHATLEDLVLRDPSAAMQVASIIRNEQEQLLRFRPDGTVAVLSGAKALVARLSKDASKSAAQVISQVEIDDVPSGDGSHANQGTKPGSKPTAKPTTAPTSKPTAKPTPKPTTKPSSPASGQPTAEPTPTPTSSPSPTTKPIIPGAPVVPGF